MAIHPDDHKAVYEALDRIANTVGLYDVIEICEHWLRDHRERPERDYYKPSQLRKGYQRQRGLCPYCRQYLVDPKYNGTIESSEQTTGDHFESASGGGKAKDSNLVVCHRRCNSQKSNMDPIEWSKRTGRPITEMIKDTLVADAATEAR